MERGDVRLTIPDSCMEQTIQLMADLDGINVLHERCEPGTFAETTILVFEDVKHSTLPYQLMEAMEAGRIPYDHDSDIQTTRFRITEWGVPLKDTISPNDDMMSVDAVEKAFKAGVLEELIASKRTAQVTVSWTDQLCYLAARAGAPSKTLEEARLLVRLALSDIGIHSELHWEPSQALGHWEYATVPSEPDSLRIGISEGGVVSINGRSHNPANGQLNVRLHDVVGTLQSYLEVTKRLNAAAEASSSSGPGL